MTAALQEKSPDHRGGHQVQRENIKVTAPSYDDAMSQVRARLPDGWRVLHVLVDRE